MTNIKLLLETKDPDMVVDLDYELKKGTIAHKTKTKTKYKIDVAPGGFIFYQITQEQGNVTSELSGKWSSMDKAAMAIGNYLEKAKMTQGAKNAYFSKEREKSKINGASK